MSPLSESLHEAPGSLGTVRNAMALLELLADGPAYQQLTDLAERSGLTVPTVHRLLRSLVLADMVEQDSRSLRYGLGPELALLSHRYLSRLPLLGALAPYLTQVRSAVGTTVQVQILVRTSVVYVDRVDGPDAGLFRAAHGIRPALTTAGGRMLLARAPEDLWAEALAAAETELRELAQQKHDAWARARTLRAPATTAEASDEVAAAVLDAAGLVLGALSAEIATTADETEAGEITGHLLRVTDAARRTLGHG